MKNTLKENEKKINEANTIIITLKNGKKYIYDGLLEFKEYGSWGYCYYNNNIEYINKMYSINSIHKIELIYKNCERNFTIHNNI